jgi:uncharacterized membrane protein
VGASTDRVAGHSLFRTALLLKGLDGAVELFAAVALVVATPDVLEGFVRVVLEHHLLGGPQSDLAVRFARGEEQLVGAGRTFAVVFLALHGLIKCGLVVAMARRIRPAFPVAAAVLGLFVVYEIYRATRTGSVLLPLFAALDLLIIALIVREYLRLRRADVVP